MIQKLIFFRNTATLDETLYSSPVGRMSVRQTLILGVGFGAILLGAMMAYNESGNDIMAALYYLPFLIIPAVLGLHKPNVLTADELFYSIISFLVKGPPSKQIVKPKKRGRAKGKKAAVSCSSMGYHTLEREHVPKDTMRVIHVADLAKPTRLKLVIRRPDGSAFVNHFVSIYLDEVRITAITTDSAGEVEVLVTPGSEDVRKLKVMAKGYDAPVIDGDIKFKRG